MQLELKNKKKFKLNHLRGLENLRQNFDREWETYLERIQKVKKKLVTEKGLCSSALTTIVSTVPGSGTGDATSPSAGGGELSSVSVEKPVH